MARWLLLVLALAASATPAAAQRRCADGLRAEVDRQSFRHLETSPPHRRLSAAQVEALRAQAGRRFREVANAMCARGQLRPTQLRRFQHLRLQQAEGANEAAFMSEGQALTFQYVFDEGQPGPHFRVPDAADVRDGLLCWSNWRRYRRMCEQRVP